MNKHGFFVAEQTSAIFVGGVCVCLFFLFFLQTLVKDTFSGDDAH